MNGNYINKYLIYIVEQQTCLIKYGGITNCISQFLNKSIQLNLHQNQNIKNQLPANKTTAEHMHG